MPGDDVGRLIIIVVLVAFSSFFSSSETAFFTLQNTSRLKHLVSIGHPGALRVSKMLSSPGRLLSTILLGNNLVNIAFTAVVTVLFIELVGEGAGVIVATIVGTVVVLIFGEIVPKTFAVRFSEPLAFLYSRPIKTIELVLFPLVIFFEFISRLASIGRDNASVEASITEAELRTLIDLGEAEGQFAPVEAEMLESVFRFGDRQVRDIMTPRTEIIFIEQGATLREFLERYAENSHTRFPVYDETTDNIIGILSSKDILRAMAANGLRLEDPVTESIRDVYFVPETKRIAELFDELRQTGHQMAIAIDEFGGVAGLVTLKRLLEEVVGRVGEEGAGPEEEFVQVDKYTYRLDGGVSIDEVKEKLGLQVDDEDFETVAGWVLEELGHIPVLGENFEYRNFTVEVTRMKDLKIERIRITRHPLPDTEGPED